MSVFSLRVKLVFHDIYIEKCIAIDLTRNDKYGKGICNLSLLMIRLTSSFINIVSYDCKNN